MPSGGSDSSLIYGLQAGEVVHSLHFLKMFIESSVFLCENGRMAMLFSALTCKIISKSCQQLWQLVTIFFANINAHHLCSPRTFQFGYLQLKSFNSILGLYLNFLLHCILHNIKPWTLKSGSVILILISIVLYTCAHKVFSFTNCSISLFRETSISSTCTQLLFKCCFYLLQFTFQTYMLL